MSEPQWQTCPKCGERWWDSHVCRNTLNSLTVALAPTCRFCGQAARAQPAQAVPLLSDDELLTIWAGDQPRPTIGKNKVLDYGREVEAAVRAKLGVAVPQWLPIEKKVPQ